MTILRPLAPLALTLSMMACVPSFPATECLDEGDCPPSARCEQRFCRVVEVDPADAETSADAEAAPETSEPDPTMGEGGLLVGELGGRGLVRGLALDETRIYLLGHTTFGDRFAGLVLALDHTGAAVPGFGREGRSMPFGAATAFVDGLVEPSGKLVLVGQDNHPANQDFALFRVLPDGDPDPDFGAEGRQLWTDLHLAGKEEQGFALARDRAGQIIGAGTARVPIGGSIGNGAAAVRVAPDGVKDANFAEGGGFTYADPQGADLQAFDVAVAPDGSIYLSLHCMAPGPGQICVARLTADGRLDPSYGREGVARLAAAPRQLAPSGLHLDPEGRLLVSGVTSEALIFARLDPRGGPDESFGEAGTVSHALGRWATSAPLPCGDGLIVGAASVNDLGNPQELAVIAVSAAGAISQSLIPLPFRTRELTIARDAQGRLLVAGSEEDGERFHLSRWTLRCPEPG